MFQQKGSLEYQMSQLKHDIKTPVILTCDSGTVKRTLELFKHNRNNRKNQLNRTVHKEKQPQQSSKHKECK